jgi:Glycosyl hydrolase family 92 catalytic domain
MKVCKSYTVDECIFNAWLWSSFKLGVQLLRFANFRRPSQGHIFILNLLIAPQDMATIVKLMGGKTTFIQRLDAFFANGFHDPGDEVSKVLHLSILSKRICPENCDSVKAWLPATIPLQLRRSSRQDCRPSTRIASCMYHHPFSIDLCVGWAG